MKHDTSNGVMLHLSQGAAHTKKRLALALLLALSMVLPVQAQTNPTRPKGAKEARVQQQSFDSKKPINVESDQLEVLDRESKAIFTGRVVATQGETTLKAEKLIVEYKQGAVGLGRETANPAKTETEKPAAGSQADRQIRRLEAIGNVVYSAQDQRATGDKGVYDAAQNTILMTGSSVSLTQGANIVTGQRLVINTLTNQARMETSGSQRVRALFIPGSENKVQR
jgi:lipopolysaccharide export system protein LptA